MVSSGCKTGIVATVTALGAVIIILTSTLGWIWYPDFVNKLYVISSDNPEAFDLWLVPPVPIIMRYYLFDCTNCNADSLTNSTFKPKFEEHGPFTFTEGRLKFDVTETDGFLGYTQNTSYVYDPQPGEESLDVNITTVNPIYYTVMGLIDSTSAIAEESKTNISRAVHGLLDGINEKPFMTHTADEILFTGWNVTGLVNLIIDLIEANTENITLNRPTEDVLFGLLSTSNNTNPGNFTIESGANDINQLGEILAFKGSPSVDYWENDYCNLINGSDGSIFPPAIPKTSKVYLFTPDLCRSLYATYEKEVPTLDIKGNRFTIPEEVLDGGSPENACFCRLNQKACESKSVIDLRACSLGAPLVMSTPHFYLGSQNLLDAVEGIVPIKEEHETHIDLEPTLSVPLFASKRIQLNVDVRRYSLPENTTVGPVVRPFYWMPDVFFPVIWFGESAAIDEKFADDINFALDLFVTVDIVRWCVLAFGIVLFVIGTIMAIVLYSQRKKKQLSL